MSKAVLTKRQAYERYRTIKQAAMSRTRAHYRAIFGDEIVLAELNTYCIEEAQSWQDGLNWQGLLEQTNTYKPRHFDVAIFHAPGDSQSAQLCGLGQGRTSKGHSSTSHVRIDYLGRAPAPNPFAGHITNIVLDYALRYAELVNKKRVLLTCPNKHPSVFSHFNEIFDGNYRDNDPNFPYDYFYMNIDDRR